MKKFIFGVLVLGAAVFLGYPASALDTNNFSINEFKVDMTLGRDGDNRSTLSTTETITAVFPDFDQNHGLERVLVKEYDGHKTSLRLESVKDKSGNDLKYSFEDGVLRIGSADVYVHGENSYVIKYLQRDVTKYFEDTGRDEFYWDVVGLDWGVVRQDVTVNLSIDQSLADSLTGDTACYQGVDGSAAGCHLGKDGMNFMTYADRLEPREGMTIALGFNPGTFAPYQKSLIDRFLEIWGVVQIALVAVGTGIVAWLVTVWTRATTRTKEKGTIVPEYLPPKNASVTTSARVMSSTNSVMTAQLLDLAVRHYIKIYEASPKGIFKSAEYEVEVIKDPSDLKWEEQELLRDTFGSSPSVGQRLNLKELQNNMSYFRRTLNNDKDLDKLIRGEYGLKTKNDALEGRFRKIAIALLVGAVLLLSPWLLIISMIAFALSFSNWTLTDEGLGLIRYLDGLKMYIKVAEEERIRMLQSPEGAEKVASVTNGTDGAQLVKLYERVLPYAVLFGQEKQWNTQLGKYYETSGTQPDWYSGQTAFNAAAFSSAMNSFSSANNYASSASSSSGGSGGGGSAGGGGGGGGGGGW